MRVRRRWWGLVVALALVGPGCDDDGGGGGGGMKARPAQAGTAVEAYEGDLAFVDGLMPHELTAMWLAEDAIAKARRPELRAYAARLKANRERDLAELRRYRRAWAGEEAAAPIDDATIATVPAGRDYDRRWAQAMIRHQQAAIDIAERGVKEAETPEARKAARRIADKEKADQAQLRKWSKAWAEEPAP